MENFLQHNRSSMYDFVYDQIVIYGELFSTTIVTHILKRTESKLTGSMPETACEQTAPIEMHR